MNQHQVGHLLGLTRMEAEDFLVRHADLHDFDPSELRREAEFLVKLPDANQPQKLKPDRVAICQLEEPRTDWHTLHPHYVGRGHFSSWRRPCLLDLIRPC